MTNWEVLAPDSGIGSRLFFDVLPGTDSLILWMTQKFSMTSKSVGKVWMRNLFLAYSRMLSICSCKMTRDWFSLSE